MSKKQRVYLRSIARISKIHKEISGGGFPNSNRLADLLSVHSRTIRRDLAFLKDELGAPLQYDRRRNGFGYSFREWSLPLQSMSEGDLLAFFIAENALRFTGQNAQAAQLRTAIAKFASLLPEHVMIDISAIGHSVSFQNQAFKSVSPQSLQLVTVAAVRQNTIEFDYFSPHKNERSHRTADVHLLHNFTGDWFAISYDHSAKDFRDFHVGRMTSIRNTGRYFAKQKNWNADDYLKRGFSMMRGGRLTTVSILFDAYQAQWIRERQHFHPEEVREEFPDGSLRLSFKIGRNGLEAVARFCLQYAGHCVAEKPSRLRVMIKEKLQRGIILHQ